MSRSMFLGAFLVSGIIWTSEVAAQPVPTDRVFAHVDVGRRPLSRTFQGTTVFTVYSEQGHFEADYQIESGKSFESGFSFLVWRNLALGLGTSYFGSASPAFLDFALPHPVFFDSPRIGTGVANGLKRRALWVHGRAVWMMQLADWLIVSISGGPSLITARQTLVSSIQYAETEFPFEQVTFTGHAVDEQSGVTLGLNTGIDIDAFVLSKIPGLRDIEVMEHIGIGLLLRYMRGAVNMKVGDAAPVDVDFGGLQLSTGLRIRF